MSKKKDYRKMVWSYDTTKWDREEMKEVFHEIYDRFPKNKTELENFIQDENDHYLGDEQANVFYYEKNHGQKFYVTQTHHNLCWSNSISYVLKQGMWNAIDKCMRDYNTIYSFNGGIHVEAFNYAGTDHCRIKELTQRGQKYYDRHHGSMKESELLQKIFNNHRYSRNPKLFKEMYGW